MRNIIIPTDLIEQDNSFAMVVYLMMQIKFYSNNGSELVVPESIGAALEYVMPLSRRIKEKIINAFDCLVELGYLNKENNYYYVDTDLFYCYETYMVCSEYAFDKLCCAPKLLRHYLILKDCEGEDFSLEFYADYEGVSTSTIKNYNRDLVALHLIKINTAMYDPATGKRSGNNTYTVIN